MKISLPHRSAVIRMCLLPLALLALLPAAADAQRSDDDERRARRDSLEAEIVRKFVAELARDLRLEDAEQAEMQRVLQASGVRRRELLRASSDLRGRLYRAVRDDDTPDTVYTRLLAEHENLRVREHQLWSRDQAEVARLLNPRQRVYFLLAWTRFQENLREILSRRLRDDDRDRDRRDGRGGDRRDGNGRDDHAQHDRDSHSAVALIRTRDVGSIRACAFASSSSRSTAT